MRKKYDSYISLYHRNPHVAGESSATDVCRYIDPGSLKQNTWEILLFFFIFRFGAIPFFLVQKPSLTKTPGIWRYLEHWGFMIIMEISETSTAVIPEPCNLPTTIFRQS